MKKLLTAGAFANLCGTTKATLRWYRKINLLAPNHIGENGYAYYTVEQVVEFTIIQTLQNIGCSLEQIKAYNEQEETLDMEFLDDKITLLDQHIEELKKQRDFLKRTRTAQHRLFERWGKHYTAGDWQIRAQEEEHYLVMNAPIVDTSVYQQRLIVFQQLCTELDLGTNVPIIMYLDKDSLQKNELATGFCIGTKINDPLTFQEKLGRINTEAAKEVKFITREAGNYFSYLAALPLEAEETFKASTASLSNPLIDGQRAALTAALREGGQLDMGLLETPLTILRQKKGRNYLFLELTIYVEQ